MMWNAAAVSRVAAVGVFSASCARIFAYDILEIALVLLCFGCTDRPIHGTASSETPHAAYLPACLRFRFISVSTPFLRTIRYDISPTAHSPNTEEYAAIREGGPFVATVADGHEFGGEAACAIAASMLAGNPAPGEAGVPILATSVLVTADNVPAEGEIESTERKFYQLP